MRMVDQGQINSVLFVTHALSLGGVSTHMHALGKYLMALGVRVGIVTRAVSTGPLGTEYFRRAGFDVFQCPFPGYGASLSNACNVIRATRRLRAISRDFHADILHVHAPTLCLIARLAHFPYVTTFNISVNGSKKQRIARIANRIRGDAFGRLSFAISDELRNNLISDLGIPTGRVRTVRYTIDDARFAPASDEERLRAREKYGVPNDAVVVSMVASLEPRKNHTLLLDAISLLQKRGIKVCTLLAGSGWGDQEELLHRAIDERALRQSVKHLGHQPAAEVYHASDIFVLTSLQEGFPLSVVEAMLSGLIPIRTPSEGAAQQIRDGESGYIVPFGNPHVLADRLEGLVRDRATRDAMRAQALMTARKQFSATLMAQEMLELYSEAIGA